MQDIKTSARTLGRKSNKISKIFTIYVDTLIFFWIMCYCKVINQSDNNHNNDPHFSYIVRNYLHICAWLFDIIRRLHASFWGPWFSKYHCIDKLDIYVMLQPSSIQFGTFFHPWKEKTNDVLHSSKSKLVIFSISESRYVSVIIFLKCSQITNKLVKQWN